MQNNWIIIPTYWTDQAKTGNFDHPTPIDGESTLPRLLDSLLLQDDKDFQVLILAGGVDKEVLPLAADAVQQICKKYLGQLELNICDVSMLLTLQDKFKVPESAYNLTSYAGIRNLQLLVPNIAGAHLVIALDDDEVVALDYVRNVRHFMNGTVNNQRVLGLAGPYEDDKGNINLIEKEKTGNIFLDKSRFMNAGLQDLVKSSAPIVKSPQVFGGNMIFHHDLFTHVGFDPGITRGEDMDYMINAHIQGFPWFMASDLRIIHLPPKHYEIPPYAKLKQDVIRFVYQRAKVQKYGLDPEQFDPYPGRFLRNDLDEHALNALEKFASSSMADAYGSPKEILDQAYEHAEQTLPRYETFRGEWIEWMAISRGKSLT